MEIQFLGAAETVTGSKYLLTLDGFRLLIDCGLYQGTKNLRQRNWKPLPVDASSVDAVVITHAHIDHSGYLPVLMNSGFSGPVYSSKATKALCNILLPDAGFLQEEEARYANHKKFSKHKPAKPLYTEADGRDVLLRFEPVRTGHWQAISESVDIRLQPVGHILGACSVEVRFKGKTIAFSGDLGREQDYIMHPPSKIESADYLVVESTYGNRHHSKEDAREIIKEVVSKTASRGGSVLFPAFAVGRAQVVLYLIQQLQESGEIPKMPVYLNSPMAISATDVFCQYHQLHKLRDEDCKKIDSNTHYLRTAKESMELNESNYPSIIISASGMASGGRVLHHLKAMLPDSKNSVVFLGFQAPGTRGDHLINGATEVKIHGYYYPVRCNVRALDSLSAHADCDELIGWMSHFNSPPKHTFVVHGEAVAADNLRCNIKNKLGWDVSVPEYLDKVTL